MKDTKLYEEILGLEFPWGVKSICMDKDAKEIVVQTECKNDVWVCPKCRQRAHIHAYTERRWRHLDSCQYKTIIQARVPRVKCKEHGTQTVCVPWAEANSRFTLLFERLAIDLLLDMSVKSASEILRISWDEADGIKQRAVKRGLRTQDAKIQNYQHLCIDEKSYARGHNYLTFVAKVEPDQSATIAYIGEGRKESVLDEFWGNLSEEQIKKIESIGVDMWKPFLQSIRSHVPDADSKIVHDPFHIIRYINEAVNTVRKQEHARLLQQGDNRLKGTKYYWLYGEENRTQKVMDNWEKLKVESLKTSRAWAIKELFRNFWKLSGVDEAKRFFKMWYGWSIRSRLKPIKKVAKMIKKHFGQIVNYFKYRTSNGPIEGLNNKVQAIVKKAYGHRNKERLKIDILFHLGGLDLYPKLHPIP